MRKLRSFCELSLACLIVSASPAIMPAAAQSVSYQVHPPHFTELKVLTAKAMRLYHDGDIKAAVSAFQAAAAQARQHFGAQHLNFAQSLNNLARIYDIAGELDRSENTYRQAIAIVESRGNRDAQQLANLQNNLAAVVLQQCRVADARALFRRALVLSEDTLGPNHTDTTMARQNVNRLDRYLDAPTTSRSPANVADDDATNFGQILQRCVS